MPIVNILTLRLKDKAEFFKPDEHDAAIEWLLAQD